MNRNAPAVATREKLLETVRERMTSRLAMVEKKIPVLQEELEALSIERIELQAKLRVLDEQLRGGSSRDDD
jgi:hypothetical protein